MYYIYFKRFNCYFLQFSKDDVSDCFAYKNIIKATRYDGRFDVCPFMSILLIYYSDVLATHTICRVYNFRQNLIEYLH